jgi:hypothetical protein
MTTPLSIKDFRPIMLRALSAGAPGCGLLFTSSRAFPRSRKNPGSLIRALAGLPHHHHQAPGRVQRPPDVRERGHGVIEEHRAEPAHGQVEALLREAVDLRVAVLEGDVGHSPRLGELAGPLDGGFGDVDPERTACPRQVRGLAGGLPEPASDVQDLLVGLDAAGSAQHLIVQPKFGVVSNEARLVHGCPAYKDPVRSAA